MAFAGCVASWNYVMVLLNKIIMRITIVIFLLIIGCNPNKSDYTIKGKYEEVLFAGIENGNINFVAKELNGQYVINNNFVQHKIPIQSDVLRALMVEDNLYLLTKEESSNFSEKKYVLSIFDSRTLNLVLLDTITGSGRFPAFYKYLNQGIVVHCYRNNSSFYRIIDSDYAMTPWNKYNGLYWLESNDDKVLYYNRFGLHISNELKDSSFSFGINSSSGSINDKFIAYIDDASEEISVCTIDDLNCWNSLDLNNFPLDISLGEESMIVLCTKEKRNEIGYFFDTNEYIVYFFELDKGVLELKNEKHVSIGAKPRLFENCYVEIHEGCLKIWKY